MVRLLKLVLTLAILIQVLSAPGLACARETEKYFGTYQIYEVQRVSGGLTSESGAKRWIGTKVIVRPERAAIRDIELKQPHYRISVERAPTQDGAVMSNDTSFFYGVRRDRKLIRRLLVYENPKERDPYMQIEIIDRNTLLDIYDGWIFFYKRVSE